MASKSQIKKTAAKRKSKIKYDLDELLQLTKQHFGKRFPSATETLPRVPRLTYSPFVGVKFLAVRADVQGLAEDKTYKVVLVFFDVSYSEKKDAVHTVKMKVDPNLVVYMKPIDKSNPVRLRCGCRDAYFRGLYYLWRDGNLYGVKPRAYQRKTTTWPSVNPAKVSMMCKHMISVYYKIRRSNKFK